MPDTDPKKLRLEVAAAARSVYQRKMPYPVFIGQYGGIDDPPIARLIGLMEKEADDSSARLWPDEYAVVHRRAVEALIELEREAGAA